MILIDFQVQTILATNNNLDTVKKNYIRNEEEIQKLQTFDLSFLLSENIFVHDCFQNMFLN